MTYVQMLGAQIRALRLGKLGLVRYWQDRIDAENRKHGYGTW